MDSSEQGYGRDEQVTKLPHLNPDVSKFYDMLSWSSPAISICFVAAMFSVLALFKDCWFRKCLQFFPEFETCFCAVFWTSILCHEFFFLSSVDIALVILRNMGWT